MYLFSNNLTGLNVSQNQLLVSLKTPYENVTEVLGFTDSITGETTSCFYNKDFRWGIDGVTYSDWVQLTDVNLQISSEGLKIISMDGSKQAVVNLKLEANKFKIILSGRYLIRITEDFTESQSAEKKNHLIELNSQKQEALTQYLESLPFIKNVEKKTFSIEGKGDLFKRYFD